MEPARAKPRFLPHFVSFQGFARRKISLSVADIARWGSGMQEIGEVSHRLVVGALSRLAIGEEVTLQFIRNGTTYETKIALKEAPAPEKVVARPR